jgi:hypothetical protein
MGVPFNFGLMLGIIGFNGSVFVMKTCFFGFLADESIINAGVSLGLLTLRLNELFHPPQKLQA